MTKKYIVFTSLLAFLATGFFGCENEDVIRTPDFIVPVMLLAKTADGSDAKTLEADTLTLNTSDTYDFILEAEDFDGDSNGHAYFTGREGVTSTLIGGELYAEFKPPLGDYGERQTLLSFGPELNDSPVTLNVSQDQLFGLFGITDPASLNVNTDSALDTDSIGVFRIRYEYTIDANNSGTVREIGLPGNDFCGGFSFEGEFCELFIPTKI